jgi:hypothetical protein
MGAEDERSDERHVWMVRASNGTAVGPVSIAQIAQALAFRRLSDADDVRHVQAAGWEKISAFMARMRAPTPSEVDGTGQLPSFDVGAPEAPPRPVGQDATSPGVTTRRSPLGGLFDFTFTTFFTARIVAVLYALVILLAAGYLLTCVGFGLMAIVRGVNAMQETGESPGLPIALGVALVVAGPVGAVIAVIGGRVVLEFIVVTFRISETLTEIKAKTAPDR